MNPAELNQEAEAALFKQQELKESALTEKLALEIEDLKDVVARKRNSDIRNRVYNFLGPITLESVDNAASAILAWDRESKDPVTLRLMSPGGEVPSGLYLYDLLSAMAQSGTPLKTVALGNANSMAAVVLQAGTKRLVGPNSWITLHEVSVGGHAEFMTVTEKEEQDETIRRINNRLVKILARRATITEKQLAKNIKKRDWTLEPEEAIKYGFADEIGYK